MVEITHGAANRPMISQLKPYLLINLITHSLTWSDGDMQVLCGTSDNDNHVVLILNI